MTDYIQLFFYLGLVVMAVTALGNIIFDIQNLSYGYLLSAILVLISIILKAKKEIQLNGDVK